MWASRRGRLGTRKGRRMVPWKPGEGGPERGTGAHTPWCLHWLAGSRLTANIFFSPSSATQGHQPFTVFCSKRDTNHSGWKVSSSRSREHFSAVLAGLGMRLRSSCKEPVTKRGSLSEGFSVTGRGSHPGAVQVPQKLSYLLNLYPWA